MLDSVHRENVHDSTVYSYNVRSKKPSGGWAPSSSSKAMFKAVEADFCATGAKAAAPAKRDAKITAFIMVTVKGMRLELYVLLWGMMQVASCYLRWRFYNRFLRPCPIFILQVW